MNAGSPGVISLFLRNDFHATRKAYLAALADATREEYRTIVDAGFGAVDPAIASAKRAALCEGTSPASSGL